MEGRLDAPPDCSAVQSSTHFGAGNPIPDGRHSAAGTEPQRKGADAGRERGDLTRHGETYPRDESQHVSQETIYRSLFIQSRGALKKELLLHLRRTRSMRRSRHHTQKTDIHGQIVGAVSISERPASAEDRAVPGHWEGDLVFGSHNSQIATLVERQTRYVMLVKVGAKDTETVVNALIKNARKLPQELYKSLTWDRGKEMAGHKRFTLATDIQVYFCDPRSPWQRGSNENTNGLLRQYMPKGIDISSYSHAKLNAMARKLNERPRRRSASGRRLRCSARPLR
jgi:IS30 family transposase